MTKKLLAFGLALLLCASLPLSALAAEGDVSSAPAGAESSAPPAEEQGEQLEGAPSSCSPCSSAGGAELSAPAGAEDTSPSAARADRGRDAQSSRARPKASSFFVMVILLSKAG